MSGWSKGIGVSLNGNDVYDNEDGSGQCKQGMPDQERHATSLLNKIGG